MRVLITGAGGFCGRHLIDYLKTQNVEIHTLGGRATSTNHHFANPDNLSAIATAVTEAKPDYVIHLAGITKNIQAFNLYYIVNTVYAANLLLALEMRGWGNCPVLLTGTSAEYGIVASKDLPITEDTPPRPYNHYGISKLAQTLMGVALSKTGRPLIIVRPFNIIGPGMPKHLVIYSFARQIADILKGNHPPVIEAGNLASSRDFIAIADVVEIYWRLIQTPAAYGEVINVCSGKGVVIGDILDRLVSIANRPIEVSQVSARLKSVDVPLHYGSPEKLRNIIGYTPIMDLDTTLKQILMEMINQQ
jgi:nucleoside-diphosphate-sugar epimerase